MLKAGSRLAVQTVVMSVGSCTVAKFFVMPAGFRPDVRPFAMLVSSLVKSFVMPANFRPVIKPFVVPTGTSPVVVVPV